MLTSKYAQAKTCSEGYLLSTVDDHPTVRILVATNHRAAKIVLPSTIERMPKKKFRKYLYNSEHDGNSIDRLSGLPQDLLVRILCLLSLKEALRTCVLSRKWRDLCQFFSGSLNFDASKTLKSDPKKLLKERDGYVESINRFFSSHKAGTIDELRVCFDLTQQHKRYIDRWIEIALVKKCERLELDFEPCRLNHRRDSENYRLGHKFSSSSETRFLTGLCLKHVNVSGRILESFLSNCPLLETLHVSHSEELTHISVCGSSLRLKLKHLHVSFCKCIKSIEVCAPNLVTFEYRGEENMTVHIDLKYVPHLCDVSYAGQWDFPRVNDRSKSIPSCLATSQLVNLSISIPYTPRSVVNSPIQPKFSNLRCLTLEFLKFHLPILHTATFVNACELFTHMPLLHKFKVELEAVEAHILTEVEEFQSIIWAGYNQKLEFKRFGYKEPMMLREVEMVGFVSAAADTTLVYFLSLFAPNLESIMINRCLPRRPWFLHRYGNQALTYRIVDRMFSQPGLGNLDNLVNAFRTPPLPGKKIEFSVASALIPDIPASEMHGKNKWSKSMFPLVKHGEEYRVVESVSSEFKQD
ncbi:hypothetical protein V6N13_002743 [Hibiscus sabdariffa]